MKKDLLDILCCSICKNDLILKSIDEQKDEIIEGFLTCTKCEKEYMIKDGIPNLLPK